MYKSELTADSYALWTNLWTVGKTTLILRSKFSTIPQLPLQRVVHRALYNSSKRKILQELCSQGNGENAKTKLG